MATVRKMVFNNDWLSTSNRSFWLARFALSNMGKQAIVSHEKLLGHSKNVKSLKH